MKHIPIALILILVFFSPLIGETISDIKISKFFNEQLRTYNFGIDVDIHNNAPSPEFIDLIYNL